MGVACSFWLLACGEDATQSDATGGTGGTGGGTGGTGGAGATACNTVTNTAATIEFMNVAQTLPAGDAMGGSVMPGTYHLVSRTVHTGPGGATGPTGVTRRQTLLISPGNSGALVVESVLSNNGNADERTSFTAMLSGTQVTLNLTCPAQTLLGTSPYTATPTSYTQYDTVEGELDVFTRQ